MYIILFVLLAIFVLIPEAIDKWFTRKELDYYAEHLKNINKDTEMIKEAIHGRNAQAFGRKGCSDLMENNNIRQDKDKTNHQDEEANN